jgi:hypothetical protein
MVENCGLVVAIWLAPLRVEQIPDIRRAIELAWEKNPEGLAVLTILRIDRRFPVRPEQMVGNAEVASLLRAVDPAIRARATVVDYDGIVGAAARGILDELHTAAPPVRPAGVFDRVHDALCFLVPQMPGMQTPAAFDRLLQLTRFASEVLEPRAE